MPIVARSNLQKLTLQSRVTNKRYNKHIILLPTENISRKCSLYRLKTKCQLGIFSKFRQESKLFKVKLRSINNPQKNVTCSRKSVSFIVLPSRKKGTTPSELSPKDIASENLNLNHSTMDIQYISLLIPLGHSPKKSEKQRTRKTSTSSLPVLRSIQLPNRR